jgi:hypothetical protein
MANAVSVDALAAGNHACLTFTDEEERRDIVASFVADGLDLGQRVICFTDTMTPEQMRGDLAGREVAVADALHIGQLMLHAVEHEWMPGGAFSAAVVVDLLTAELTASESGGFTGLRVTADMSWATRPRAGAVHLGAFESQINKVFGGKLTSICQYDREQFDPVTLAMVAETHPFAVAAATYHHDALLRICRQYRPRGIRVAGEIDHRAIPALRTALTEAVHLDQHISINLSEVRFIDAGICGELLNTAACLPDGRQMFVRCPGHVAKMLRVLNPEPLSQLRIVVTDDRF